MTTTKTQQKIQNREARRRRVRAKVYGTADRPRLSVHRSNKQLRVQIINDDLGQTLCAASSISQKAKTMRERIEATAAAIAEQANGKNIKDIVFDRGGFSYEGNIKLFAEAARNAGLNF